MLAVAAAEMDAVSERRIAMLTDPILSGLATFPTRDPGLKSGFMIACATAAALASENKNLPHPASVDSLPTSVNQEDQVSIAISAAFGRALGTACTLFRRPAGPAGRRRCGRGSTAWQRPRPNQHGRRHAVMKNRALSRPAADRNDAITGAASLA